MPNWCENNLVVIVHPSTIELIVERLGLKQEQFNVNAIIPYPNEFAQQDEDFINLPRDEFEAKYGKGASDGYNAGGYKWCIEHWGTKWPPTLVCWEQSCEQLRIDFDTAWSPPLPIIRALHCDYPDSEFRLSYFESGCAYGGLAVFEPVNDYRTIPGIPSLELEGTYTGTRGG